MEEVGFYHRELGFFLQSSELGPPPPHPQTSVSSPLRFGGGGTHSLAGDWEGGPSSNVGTEMWYTLGI